MHENLERKEDTKVGSERGFGIVFAVACAIIGGLLFWKARPSFLYWLLASAAFAMLAMAVPRVLRPLNLLWFKFGLLLHHIISPLVLGLMFFVVFAPIGLLMRAMGKHPLNLRFDRNAESYWIHRRPPGPPPDSFNNQF